jgi:hypothetical protein
VPVPFFLGEARRLTIQTIAYSSTRRIASNIAKLPELLRQPWFGNFI